MNIVRKLKLNKIHPVEFTEDEMNIINSLKPHFERMIPYIVHDFSNDKYKNHSFYFSIKGKLILSKSLTEEKLFIYKPFVYEVMGDKKDNVEIINAIKFFFKEYPSKKTPEVYNIAVNFIEDILRENWVFEVPL